MKQNNLQSTSENKALPNKERRTITSCRHDEV